MKDNHGEISKQKANRSKGRGEISMAFRSARCRDRQTHPFQMLRHRRELSEARAMGEERRWLD